MLQHAQVSERQPRAAEAPAHTSHAGSRSPASLPVPAAFVLLPEVPVSGKQLRAGDGPATASRWDAAPENTVVSATGRLVLV